MVDSLNQFKKGLDWTPFMKKIIFYNSSSFIGQLASASMGVLTFLWINTAEL